MIELWLIRHGETVENARGVCQGQNPGTLTENGILQAKAVGKALSKEQFDYFYSSDLRRTMDTMVEIVKYHPGKDIISEPLLRERYLAAWQGKRFPENWKTLKLPEGAETNEDLMERARKFLHTISLSHSNHKIAVMSHGGLIRALWTVLHGKGESAYYSWEAPQNTCVSCFQILQDGKVTCLFQNQLDHLKSV